MDQKFLQEVAKLKEMGEKVSELKAIASKYPPLNVEDFNDWFEDPKYLPNGVVTHQDYRTFINETRERLDTLQDEYDKFFFKAIDKVKPLSPEALHFTKEIKRWL